MAATVSQFIQNNNSYSAYNHKSSANNPQYFPILFSH